MNVGDIKNAVADGYLQQDQANFVKGTTDMLLLAINNARRHAERLHDFVEANVYATLSVDPDSGGDLEDATLVGGGAFRYHRPDQFYLHDAATGVDTPINHMAKKNLAMRIRELERYGQPSERYPSDVGRTSPTLSPDPSWVFIQGRQIYLHPKPTEAVTLRMDVYKWFEDYTDDGDEDYFTETAPDYLIWGALVEGNHLFPRYLQQQEGSLPPPVRMRDEALASLIEDDNYTLEAGRISGQ